MTLDTNSVAAVAVTAKPMQQSQATNGKPKEKRRSNEKRKEKSRDAARCRRSRETEIFTELAQVLPLPKEEVDQLDKASVMRLAIGQLKIRDMLQLFPKIKDVLEEPTNDTKTNKETNTSEEDTTQSDDEKEEKLFDLWKTAETHKILMQTLDGFLIILSNDGDVTYVSENITEYLGISKIDILGQQIWEYSHQCDHDELKEAMNIKKNVMNDKVKDENLIEEGIITDHRDLFIRLKCTLTSRGRSVNIKSATYKVIHITGHLVVNAKGDRVLIAIGRPIPHPSNIEIPLGSTTFLTKHSLDMKFTYVDDKMSSLFGYKPDDLLDKSLYDCHHGGDSDSLMATFKSVLSKGQGETCRYRFLGKCGGYCWIVTQATIVYDKQKPQSVVCVNYVLSNLENNNEIYSLAQYEASQVEQTESNVNNTTTADQPQKLQQQQQPEPQQKPIELSENTPKLIQQQQATPQKQQQQKQSNKQIEEKQNELVINLDSGLVPELPKKTCADVDEKKSTSAGELQLKREQPSSAISQTNSTNINVIANTKPAATSTIPTVTATPPIAVLQQPIEQVNNSKYVPPVTSFRNRPYRPILLGRLPLNNNSTSSTKYGDENRPKSVTASVFRSASDIEKPIISASGLGLNHTIVVNQANLPQLMVAPTAQSVTASVFTPISQLRTPQIIQSANRAKILIQPKQYQQQQQQQARAQRAAAMNKGYLTFPMDTSTLTMLKEEPDDLAHLAPSGVDALDDSTPLFNDMLAGLMSYSNLLPDDINSLDSQHGGNQTTPGSVNNKGHIDPFINYREESNDTNCSQHLLSPSINSKSPEASSLPSLCSPNSLSQDDDFPFMTMNVDDEIDLSMRAPFIPMNEQDDLPLLTDDLMWGVGFTAEDLNNYKEDGMQYSSLKQQMNISTNNQMLNSAGNNNNNCTSNTNLANLSPAASPMSISSSSAASSPSPCSSNSPLSMHNQHCGSYGGSLLCNTGSGDIIGSGGGGGGDGGGSSARSVDDSDSGISSINSMSPQHTHPSHKPLNHQSHHSQQQQQHHSPMSVVNDSLSLITCKKEIDAGSLCDSIDAFDSGYSKDSPNLECWVPELLNINSNDSRVTVDELQQTHKQQNIIINTATMPTTTLHVPLITIQNNKNISMNQQQQRTTTSSSSLISGKLATNTPSSSASSSPSSTSSSSPSALLSSATTSYCHNNNSNNSNSNKQCTDGGGGGSLMLTEEMLQNNRKLTGKMPTSNTPTTLRILNGNLTNGRNQTSPKTAILHTANLAALQGNNHKRHLVTGGASVLDPKRLKNSSTVEIQTTPRLLQQLMAPGPQKHTIVEKTPNGGVYEKAQLQPTQRWANENNGGGLQQQMLRNQQQQDSNLNHNINQTLASSSSNSVLKNLLVSGCDNIIIKSGPEIMITEDMSNDSIAQLSPCDSFSSINCDTSDSNILRNCRSNPMIGGPVLLPSPPFPPDDNPPELLSMSENEASCDSGIDDSCAMKPTIIKNLIPDAPEKLYPKVDIIKEALKSGDVLISNVDQCTTNTVSIPTHGTPPTADRQEEQQQQQQANNMSRNSNRKSSLSFMDNGNPVLTSILMDLCNDDYNMNESDYLEDTDLVQVLNNLTDDIILSGGDKA